MTEEIKVAEGLTLLVTLREDGQTAVAIKDDDSGEIVPGISIFPTRDQANGFIAKFRPLAV